MTSSERPAPPEGNTALNTKHESAFGHYLIPRFLRMAALAGFHLDRSARILDFGCGDGSIVYAWRDEGFDAYGFDIHDNVKLRSPEDARFFRVGEATNPGETGDTRIDAKTFRIGFDDASFDFVSSLTVLEHVQDHDAVFRELSRVMRPKSIAFHMYPGSYALFEPHINVPLATQVQSLWWFRLWAKLGVRNSFQAGKTAEEVAMANFTYAKTGLNYLSPNRMFAACSPYYNDVRYTPEFWEFPADSSRKLFASEWARKRYTWFRDAVLMTAKY
jgi:SAM-dependent methyltransferase